MPFVMGTTGGDREQLVADTLASGTYAVIAPQMGKQVRRIELEYIKVTSKPSAC